MKPFGRSRTGRIFPRLGVMALTGTMALAACDQGALVGTADTKAKASSSPAAAASSGGPPGLGGNVADSGSSPRPATSPSANASAPPTASEPPTPSPSPTPTQPPAEAVSLRITPSSNLVIHLRPPAGATPRPGMPSTIALTAEVRLNSGALDAQSPTWESSDPSIATVSASGEVSAGSRTGTASIMAISADGRASGSVVVTVRSEGDVDLTVE